MMNKHITVIVLIALLLSISDVFATEDCNSLAWYKQSGCHIRNVNDIANSDIQAGIDYCTSNNLENILKQVCLKEVALIAAKTDQAKGYDICKSVTHTEKSANLSKECICGVILNSDKKYQECKQIDDPKLLSDAWIQSRRKMWNCISEYILNLVAKNGEDEHIPFECYTYDQEDEDRISIYDQYSVDSLFAFYDPDKAIDIINKKKDVIREYTAENDLYSAAAIISEYNPTKSREICDMINDDDFYYTLCYRDIIRNTARYDIESALEICKSTDYHYCYDRIVQIIAPIDKEKAKSICDTNYASSDSVRECYYIIATNANDIQFCKENLDDNSYKECLKFSCNDIACCQDNLEDEGSSEKYGKYESECLKSLASRKNDISICDLIKNDKTKRYCIQEYYRHLAEDEENVSICDNIDFSYSRSSCISQVNSIIENKNNKQKIEQALISKRKTSQAESTPNPKSPKKPSSQEDKVNPDETSQNSNILWIVIIAIIVIVLATTAFFIMKKHQKPDNEQVTNKDIS